jgi:hypothetical protein
VQLSLVSSCASGRTKNGRESGKAHHAERIRLFRISYQLQLHKVLSSSWYHQVVGRYRLNFYPCTIPSLGPPRSISQKLAMANTAESKSFLTENHDSCITPFYTDQSLKEALSQRRSALVNFLCIFMRRKLKHLIKISTREFLRIF